MTEPDAMGVEILNRLACDPERLGRFIDTTGLRADTLRDIVGTPEFWIALFDYVVADEPLLIEIASEINETPERIAAAQRRLSPPTFFE